MREWRKNNPDKVKANQQKYLDNNYPRLLKEENEKYHTDPEFRKKRLARAHAIHAYPETQTCEVDGCDNPGQRHHDDYSNALEIRWLCTQHHMEKHYG